MKKTISILTVCSIFCCSVSAQNTASPGALLANTTGYRNSAFGTSALGANTIGYANTAIGHKALETNIAGTFNTAIGGFTLTANNLSENTAVGYKSQELSTGGQNVSLGHRSLQLSSGWQNIAIGSKAMLYSQQGLGNTAIGYESLRQVSGQQNIGLGYQASTTLTTGSNNVLIGSYSTGYGLTTGVQNITIGSNTKFAGNSSYNIVFGFRSQSYGDNNIIIGKRITLPTGVSNGLNIGGVLFGKDMQSIENTPDGVPSSSPNNGKIGINVVNPTATLDVAGDAKISSNLTVNGNLNFGVNSLVGIGTINPQAKLQIDAEGNQANIEDNPNNGLMIRGTDQVLYMGANSTEHVSYIQSVDYATTTAPLLLNARGGNVGVGLSNPQSKLDVNGDIRIPNGSSYWIGSNTDAGNRLRMHHNGNTAFIDFEPALSFRSGVNTVLHLNQNGTIGIGTTNTGSHKLAVEGSIGAREVKVYLGAWADFVFEKDYKLPSLAEVEKHIQENGHLKDIPSASEVEQNGVGLGEMNARLLQKVEELTLYIIEQNKRLEALETSTQNK